jgi:hypothetical protein
MKDLTFISNVNGLQVTAPAGAYPSPSCGATMCPGALEVDDGPAPFACTPQLDPGDETPVVFSITAAVFDGGESGDQIGAQYIEDDWAVGDGPDGAPVGTVEFSALSDEEGAFGLYYDDGTTYESVTLSIFDSEGNALVEDAVMDMDGSAVSYGGEVSLVDGDTYCIVLTFVPFEEE